MFDSVATLLGEVLACGASAPAGDQRDEPAQALSEHDLVERIAAAERLAHALAAAQTRDIHALAQARRAADRVRSGVGDRLEGRTTPFEVALAIGVSPQAATSRIMAAQRLVDHHPALLALADRGRVSAWALRLVLRQTDVLDPDQAQTVAAQLAADLERQGGLTPGQLEQAARRRVAAIDPDADTRRCARARADRQISIRDRIDGTATLWARLKAEESVALWASLDGHARGRRDDGDPRSIAALMCDTLVERVTGIRIDPVPPPGSEGAAEADGEDGGRVHTPGPDPDPWDLDVPDPYQHHTSPDRTDSGPAVAGEASSARAPVELQVVIAASTLLGLDDQPGMLRGYGTIPAGLVRQIADQAHTSVLRRLVCDPIDGRLLAMDTKTRCYQGSSRQFIAWRDQHCRLSGADIKQDDHIIEYAKGGPTSVANGQGLAKNPHLIRDHPDIRVHTMSYRPDPAADPDPQHLLGHAQLARLRGQAPDVMWTMPTRHAYRQRPPPALGHGSLPTRHQRTRSPRPLRPETDPDP